MNFQNKQKVVVRDGGDNTRVVRVQPAVDGEDQARYPRIDITGVSGRDQEIQIASGDSSRIPKVYGVYSLIAPLKTSLVLAAGTGSATFTRATTATVWGYGPTAVSGDSQVLLTCASDEARFTGARRISEGVWSAFYADGTPIADATLKGYLAEGARTNHLTYGNDITNAAWTKLESTLTANNAVGPDGTTTATKYLADSGSGRHAAYQPNVSVTSSTDHVYTTIAKQGTARYLYVRLREDNASTEWTSAVADLQTGTITATYGSAAAYDATIAALGSGWYGVTIHLKTAAAKTQMFVLSGIVDEPTPTLSGTTGDHSWTAAGTEYLYLWGYDLQTGAFPSSFIPTTTAAVTRNADLDSWPTTSNFSDTAGTIYFEAQATSWANASGRIVGDAAEGILASSANSGVQGYDGTNTVNGSAGSPSGQIKCAVSWSGTTMNICVNGGTVATGTYDGAWNLSAIFAGNGFFGNVRNIRIAQVAFSNATLQAITA